MNRSIIFYETDTGKIPVQEFLDRLDLSVVKKIAWTLQLIKENARVPKTYFKKLENTDGIWEVRVKLASNIYRLFSFWDKDNLVIVTHGIIKKSQKTPVKEIRKAEKYKTDYFRRKK
jgi:phage-related protein